MTIEPWLLVTPEQLKQGWIERLPDGGLRVRDYEVLARFPNDTIKVRNPALQSAETVDIEPRRGDVRYTCPVCGWSVTLTPQGDNAWTHDGAIEPRCRKDRIALDRTVLT